MHGLTVSLAWYWLRKLQSRAVHEFTVLHWPAEPLAMLCRAWQVWACWTGWAEVGVVSEEAEVGVVPEKVTAELHWDLLSGIVVLGMMEIGWPSMGMAFT